MEINLIVIPVTVALSKDPTQSVEKFRNDAS